MDIFINHYDIKTINIMWITNQWVSQRIKRSVA